MANLEAPDMDFNWPKLKQPFIPAREPWVEGRFDAFHMHSEVYTTVGEDHHDIQAFVLVPKNLGSGPCPVHVKFHGGGFATGAGDYNWWHHAHHTRFAEQNNAITIMPNYRLMPEHNGKDILSDIDAFWTWFHDRFPAFMAEQDILFNKDQLMVSGESAGCFLAVYSWLTQPKETNIKALYLQYPMLFHYSREPGIFFDEPVSLEMANKHLDKCLTVIQELKEKKTLRSLSAAYPPFHMTMAYCLSATGRWEVIFDHDDIKGILDKKKDEPATFPQMYIYHGDEDVQVPIKNTHTFVNDVLKKWPGMGGKIHFETVMKQAHAGDYEVDEREAGKEWLRDMLAGIKSAWLA